MEVPIQCGAVHAYDAGGVQPGLHPFADQVPLELGQGGKEMEDELAGRRGRVEAFLQRDKVDAARLQPRHLLHQVLEIAAQPVQAPHDEGIGGPGIGQGLLQVGALGGRGGPGADVRIALFTPRGLQGVVLQGGILVRGGNAGVPDVHGPGL